MFDRKTDEYDDAEPTGEARDGATAPVPLPSRPPEANANLAPPPPPPRAAVSLSEKPSRLPEMPDGRGRRPDQPGGDDGKKLVVGRQIALKGEISSCDRLVVEGRLEAIMKDCREIEIAETGTFKGQVEFDRADISGVFEDELTAREHLVVRATGRVTGKVRFGELEIERGGQIIGDVQTFGKGAAAGRDAETAVDTPDE